MSQGVAKPTEWCVNSEDLDQPAYPDSLISLCSPPDEALAPLQPIIASAKTDNRLYRCTGWSESSQNCEGFSVPHAQIQQAHIQAASWENLF